MPRSIESLSRATVWPQGRVHVLRGVLVLGLAAMVAGCASAPPSGDGGARNAGASGAGATAAQQAPSPDVRERFERALAAMREARYDEARPILQALAAEHPELSGPHANLGIIAVRAGNDPASALKHFRAAATANPGNAVAHNWIGVLLRQRGAHEAAERAYLRAVDVRPDYAKAHRNIGILYDAYLDKPERAQHHYRRYLALESGQDSLIVRVWLNALPGVKVDAPVLAASEPATGGRP